MANEAVMLAAVLVPCLLAILVVSKLLYCAFYRDWMGRCLHSGPRARKKPSRQRSQRQGRDDNRNDNENDDVEALQDQGHPSVVFSHGRPIQPVGLR